MYEDSPRFSFFKELKNAIKGTDADYTSISVRKAIFLLAVPMVLELVMESGTFRRILGCLYIETSVGLFTLWLFSRGKWKSATV